VYCTALDNGFTPCDRIVDQRVTIKYVEDGKDMTWSPHNADWEFTGRNMTLRYAMARSCNSVTVQLSEKVGFQKVADYAKKLGINSPLKPVPSIGLGSNDVSLLEMVAAYSTFLNKGIYTKPMLVTKITDRDGNLIKEFKPVQKRVLSEATANMMVYMLKGGLEEPGGTSEALWDYPDLFGGNEIGGKTGTSSNYSDGWFMGVTKDFVAGTWVGGEDRCIHFRKTEKMEGCHTALPVFGIFMTKVYNDPKTKITKGKFPKAIQDLKKEYYCPTAWEKKDTTDSDEKSADKDKKDSK
jgi:penicillin-binding protein 1A